MSNKNSQFITGLLVGAAVTYLLTRRNDAGNVVVLPADKPAPLPTGGSINQQPYNPFRYLPGDLGRQLPAIYANA